MGNTPLVLHRLAGSADEAVVTGDFRLKRFRYPGGEWINIRFVELIRRDNAFLCVAGSNMFPLEHLYIEFTGKDYADSFAHRLAGSGAEIFVNVENADAYDEFAQMMAGRSAAERTECLDELLEVWGVDFTDGRPQRDDAGVLRTAVMHDDGVAVFGFSKGEDYGMLASWMRESGFTHTRIVFY